MMTTPNGMFSVLLEIVWYSAALLFNYLELGLSVYISNRNFSDYYFILLQFVLCVFSVAHTEVFWKCPIPHKVNPAIAFGNINATLQKHGLYGEVSVRALL